MERRPVSIIPDFAYGQFLNILVSYPSKMFSVCSVKKKHAYFEGRDTIFHQSIHTGINIIDTLTIFHNGGWMKKTYNMYKSISHFPKSDDSAPFVTVELIYSIADHSGTHQTDGHIVQILRKNLMSTHFHI